MPLMALIKMLKQRSIFLRCKLCLIWGGKHPRVILEKALLPERVPVWCPLWWSNVNSCYFVDTIVDEVVTIHDIHCRQLIVDFIFHIFSKATTVQRIIICAIQCLYPNLVVKNSLENYMQIWTAVTKIWIWNLFQHYQYTYIAWSKYQEL